MNNDDEKETDRQNTCNSLISDDSIIPPLAGSRKGHGALGLCGTLHCCFLHASVLYRLTSLSFWLMMGGQCNGYL